MNKTNIIIRGLNRLWGHYGYILAMWSSLLVFLVFMNDYRLFWLDECLTWLYLDQPNLNAVWNACLSGINNAPPLYFLLLWCWTNLFGLSELSLRLYSMLMILPGLIAVSSILADVFDRKTAQLAVILVCICSALLKNEMLYARFYTQYFTLVALGFWIIWQVQKNNKLSYGIILVNALVNIALIWTFYLGIFYSIALMLSVLITDLLKNHLKPKLYASYVISWLSFCFWLPNYFVMLKTQGGPLLSKPGPFDLVEFFDPSINVSLLATFVFAIFTLQFLSFPVARNNKNASNQYALLFTNSLVLFLVPLGFWAISILYSPITRDRYALPSIIFYIFAIAVMLSLSKHIPRGVWLPALPPRIGRGLMHLVMLGICLYPVARAKSNWGYFNQADFPKPKENYNSQIRNTIVVVSNDSTFFPRFHYMSKTERESLFWVFNDKSVKNRYSSITSAINFISVEELKERFDKFVYLNDWEVDSDHPSWLLDNELVLDHFEMEHTTNRFVQSLYVGEGWYDYPGNKYTFVRKPEATETSF